MDIVTGLNGTLVCQSFRRKSRGVFYGNNPLKFDTPVLYAQVSLSALVTAILQYFLTPLGETAFISQMIGGILLGPSIIGNHFSSLQSVFARQSFYICETFAFFGCMLFLFLVGVKMDISMVRKSGKKAVGIGLCTFFIPLIFNTTFASILTKCVSMDTHLHKSLVSVAALEAQTSFYVISCLLADLKLLNSELGRLAISSSLISGICSWIWFLIVTTTKQSLRGQHFLFGPMILGIVVPDGPPLGSALVEKLDSYVSGVLLPLFFVVSGAKIKFSLITLKNFGIVQLLAIFSFIGKLIGTMLPSLYCKMPVLDALLLGLIMNAQGITDILILKSSMRLQLIDEESSAIMILSMILITGTITPIVKLLYKPSKRYTPYKRRTIQHAGQDAELRILACIYHENNTLSFINLLEISHATPKSPICFYVVHLTELAGRSFPLLVAHQPKKNNSIHSHQSDHIINAFKLYAQQHEGLVMVNPFTSISPYVTMHEDVCALAQEKRASLVIIPFHKQWTISGTKELENTIRSVNRNILRKSPCSVGILVDRGTLQCAGTHMSTRKPLYSIGMIFLGGQDDREALAYGMRVSEHPNVRLTVVRFIDYSKRSKYSLHKDLDFDVTNEFRHAIKGNRRHVYKEEVVKDSVEMISVIKTVENSYDLILLGRRHPSELMLVVGLTAWNEFPELGFIGDLLVSSDSSCRVSVLVVQQQAFACEEVVNSPNKFMGSSCTVLDMPLESRKFWPTS
ncbi:hypothetical protein L1049_013935 [Liquidambar formosana]|uniref:Cation/H+ exchanger domain-containing protein n=1 Tax=Liquidambar formosana TaxID=63359 RepID=A0AAP0RM59_LIQFO